MGVAATFDMGRRAWARIYRRFWSGYPNSATPESNVAWQERQFKYYSTPQPYSSPLTVVHGNLTGETHEMRIAYREWAIREPSAKAALLTKCLAVCQLDPQLIPADASKHNDRESARWIKYAIDNSEEGFPGLLFNMLFPALTDGFSLLEKVLGQVEDLSSPYANAWTLSKAASIDTAHVRFRLDLYRQVTAVQSTMGVQGAYALSPKDFMIFTHLKLFENPFGNSDMRAAVRACRLIESAIRLRHILLTNYSGPFLKATAGDTTARQKLIEILEDARANGWIVVPEGTQLEVITLAVANLETFRSAIEDYRQEIVTAIQGAYLQLLEGGITDGRGNTQVHAGIAELFQWWLATWAAQVINKQLIPDLHIARYGYNSGMPRLVLGGIDEEQIGKALDRFKKGHELGLTLRKGQVTEVGGFESPDTPEDSLPPPPQQTAGGQTPDTLRGLSPFAHRGQEGGGGLGPAPFLPV